MGALLKTLCDPQSRAEATELIPLHVVVLHLVLVVYTTLYGYSV